MRRFESRRDDPLKSWKLTEEDWHNRAKRQEYEAAVEEMLERTDHHLGPGPGRTENKRYARVKVLHTVISRIEEGMRRTGMEPPPSRGADFDPLIYLGQAGLGDAPDAEPDSPRPRTFDPVARSPVRA